MHIGLCIKLCISACEIKFHVCFLFQQVKIISQLFRNPALKIFGAGFVLCHIMKFDVSNLWSRQLYHLPSWLYEVKINRLPVGLSMRINSSAHSSGLKSILSHSATSLFMAERPGNGMLPVECCPKLYGGSVNMKSIELSGIFLIISLLSALNIHLRQFGSFIYNLSLGRYASFISSSASLM